MTDARQSEVVKVQQDTQDNWTRWYNYTAKFRYPHISPLRKITSALRRGNVPRRGTLRVLEYGFGHGHLIFWFKPPTGIYGVELSAQAVDAASARARRDKYAEFKFTTVDKENSISTGFPASFFDLVLSSHTMEHVWDDEALLQEFRRILKPNGMLLIVVPHERRDAQIMAVRESRRNPDFPQGSYHVFQYNIETLDYLARAAGFRVKTAEKFDAVMSWRVQWPRTVAQLFSAALPFLPYSLFVRMDSKAQKAGYAAMQALVFCEKQ